MLDESLWTSAADMSEPRLSHTATLLPNGKVLLAGGYDDDIRSLVATVEIYDPTTNHWSAAAANSTPRACLLAFTKNRSVRMHTFEVSLVAVRNEYIPTLTAHEVLQGRLGSKYEACGVNFGNLIPGRLHPLIGATAAAFATAAPLELSPDDIWLCIAQGFAAHVDANAEALRDRFVSHLGKLALIVRRDWFARDAAQNDWAGCLGEFSDQLAEHLGKQRDLVVADFSTTGTLERRASEVVLMSAMKSYFEYVVSTRSSRGETNYGIPRVSLLGSVDDWRSIRERAPVLAEYGLGWWVEALVPLLDQLVAAASGRPDTDLWRSFYKQRDSWSYSGVSGWVNVFFPYLEGRPRRGETVRRRNEHLDSWSNGSEWHRAPDGDDFPNGLSTAPFTWDCAGVKLAMEYAAGLVGVSQNPETRALRPAIGWAVRYAPT